MEVNQGGIGNINYPLIADLDKSISRAYDVLLGSQSATVLIDDEENFYSFGAKIPLSKYISIMGGSRDLVEVFAGISINFYDNTSLEIYINNFIGNNVRSNVPIYSIRLKAFDIF